MLQGTPAMDADQLTLAAPQEDSLDNSSAAPLAVRSPDQQVERWGDFLDLSLGVPCQKRHQQRQH